MALVYYEGTVKPAGGNHDPEEASNRLHKAIRGLGTDEKVIIDVLAGHINYERQEIKKMYKTMFGQDLVEDLKSDLSGNFEKLCLYLLMPSRMFDAWCLYQAIEGLGTDEERLIEILCTKTNGEIQDIKEEYLTFFKRSLEDDVRKDTSGHFQHILISLLQGNRSEDQEMDDKKVQKDARDLYEAGENRVGTHTSVFNSILASRSPPHLQAVFDQYRRISQQDIEGAIRSETSGNLCKAFLAIVKCIKDPTDYYAECIHKCIKGLGTNDERLMELIVSHCEIDLKDIGDAYLKKYGESLPLAIKGDTSGDYGKLLVRLATPQ
ncbi:annexin A4-like [Saccostrea echinata]|uniref:annexin A4-like n=1 Tax=Saccostrea echinata TaxID=191078 RepID=UPI002A80A7CF|nr:annexin A4-like [Saccostrea echinata]